MSHLIFLNGAVLEFEAAQKYLRVFSSSCAIALCSGSEMDCRKAGDCEWFVVMQW